VRKVPAAVWVLVGLNAALMCVYALLFPPYTGFDEPQHVDMTIAVQHGEAWPWPGPGQLPLSVGVAESSNPVYFGPLSRHPYTNDPYPDDRNSLEELGGRAPSTKNYPNQMVQHPPAFYVMGAGLLALLPGDADWPYDRVVGVLRLLSIALLAPLPLLAFHAASRLTASQPTAVTAAALSLAIPGLTRVGANVQNDNLLILAASGLLLALVRVVTGDLSLRTAVAVGLLTSLALLTKGFALVLPVVVLVAYAANRRGWWRSAAVALAVGAVGGSWYLVNLLRFGTLQPEGLGAVADADFRGPQTPGVVRPLTTYVSTVAQTLDRRFWGAIGTPDSPGLAPRVCWLLTAVAVVLAVVAVMTLKRRRLALGMLLLPVPLTLLVVVAGSLPWYRFNGRLPGVQGRYLYPCVLGLLVVCAVGLVALLRRRARLAPVLAVLFALVMQAWALSIMLREYWVPGSDLAAGADGVLHWSPWPAPVTVLPFAAVALLAPAALFLVAREALHRARA
jgi:small subunit ribosomal protein S36